MVMSGERKKAKCKWHRVSWYYAFSTFLIVFVFVFVVIVIVVVVVIAGFGIHHGVCAMVGQSMIEWQRLMWLIYLSIIM